MSSSLATITGNSIEGRQRVNWLALKLLCVWLWRETWFAVAGFALGTGMAMEAGGSGHDSTIVSALVVAIVTVSLKVADILWDRRKKRFDNSQETSKTQQQSADRVAELTVEERRDIRALMEKVYGHERAAFESQVKILEVQVARMESTRTQDVRIIDSLGSQLRLAEERNQELERRLNSSLGK